MLENPYLSPQVAADAGRSARRRWPYLGWLAPVITWTPALLLIGLMVPGLSELFDQLRENAELPAWTSAVMAAAQFSRALFHLPVALFLTALIAGDAAIADFAQRRQAWWLHKLWQTAICVCGMIAAALIGIGLLLPLMRFPVLV